MQRQAVLAADALIAARLLAADAGLGGAVVRAPAGPQREAWLAAYRAAAAGPLVRLPLHIDDDRLLGGIDLAATIAAGRPVATRGLLAEAAGGTVVVPLAERIGPALAGRLAAAMDGGLRVVLLDEGEGDEGVPAALAERCGLWVDVSGRETAAAPAAAPAPRADEVGPPPAGSDASTRGADRDGAAQGAGGAALTDEAVGALCATALAFGVDSARASVFAVRAARIAAALDGRAAVADADLTAAARLVLAPRATRLPPSPEADAPPADAPPENRDDADVDDGENSGSGALADRVVAAVQTALPPSLLAALAGGRAPPGRGAGGGAARRSLRGRPLPSRAGALRGGQRLALVDTLRAAAPWQGLRRPPGTSRVIVRRDDFRVRRFAERSAVTTIFAVDASGSAAAARLAEAKGAVELLLAEAYVTRAEVALVAFRGTRAEIVLPPTRSLARAKRVLADLAGGGGTPLAAGVALAAALARAERGRGRTTAVVVLTDGRANIAGDGTASRERAAADALAAARALAASGTAAVFIDTSARPRPEGAALAAAMAARYAALPAAGAAAMAGVVRTLVPDGAR